MRLSHVLFLFVSISFLCGMMGCDSVSSIEDPNKSHFIKFFGGDGDQTGEDLVALSDGTFILFGTTRSSAVGSNSQWYLAKADAKGNRIWEKTFGGTTDEEASDIELTSDGRLVAVGNTYKTSTDRDVRIMTFTLDGDPLDSALIPILDNSGNVTKGDEEAASVTETSDGFIIAGSTTYVSGKTGGIPGSSDPRDGLSIRVKKDLKPYQNGWPITQTYGTYSDDVSKKIYQVSDGFYLFGFSNSPNSGHTIENYNVWYYKIGFTGISLNNNYLGNQSEDEKPSSVSIAPPQSGGGFILAGITYNQSGAGSMYVSRLRSSLVFNASDDQFRKSLSIVLGSNLNERTSVFASQQGGFYVLTNEKSFNDNQNWILTKVNNDGGTAWNLPIVYGGEGPDSIGAVQELPEGRLVLIGTMRTGKSDTGELKLTLIKVNQDGKFLN